VDDDALNRQTFADCLQQAGFRTREAATGQEALRQTINNADPPDLVILDVNLPDVDGFEVCRQIKAHPPSSAIPVLHLSGVFIQAHDRARGLECADGYLTKPADPEEVIATVRALLRVRHAEEAARAAARDWQATFDAIQDALFLLDAEGRASRCNRAAAALLGRPPEEIAGRPCRALFVEAFGDEGAALFDSARTGDPAPEVTLGTSWRRVSTDPAPWSGGSVLRISDVTAHRILEERLRHSEKLEAVGRLAGGVAHEFNNLLTAVTANLSLALQTTEPTDSRRELLRAAEAAAWRAADLTRQLLGFARRSEFQPGPTDLNECIREATALLRPTLGRQIELEVTCDPELWLAPADPGRVLQVLMNLCLNARDAMPKGGAVYIETANATPQEVEAAGRVGDFVRLRVRDTGPGVPREALAHLFEPFYTTKGVGKGTGLGLAVVYGIVEEHGGWVECTSEPGKGACFNVYLPRLGEAT
jgi:PAS domain S-box-containing protein